MPSARRRKKPIIAHQQVHVFADRLFGEDMHAARVGALANGVTGVLEAGQLGILAIGRGLAAVQGLVDKRATKQVDRLIGNEKLNPVELSMVWAKVTLAGLAGVAFVNLDWTEFDADDQSMLVVSLQGSGRATPLLWSTVRKSEMKGRRNDVEDELIARLAECPSRRTACRGGCGPVLLRPSTPRHTDRGPRPGLHHPHPQGHPGHRREGTDPASRRVGQSERPDAHAQRCLSHLRQDPRRCSRHGQGQG